MISLGQKMSDVYDMPTFDQVDEMTDSLKQRLFDLGYGTGSKTPSEAITYIEDLELELYEINELYGQVKDGLEEKLAKAMDIIKRILNAAPDAEDHTGWAQLLDDSAAVLAELVGKE